MERNQCTVGAVTGGKCHLTTYSKTVGVNDMLKHIEPPEREIIMWRAGLSILNINATVCFHHKYVYLKRYSLQQKVCCNPFNIHSSVKKGSLREITLKIAKDLCSAGRFVVPGQKLCPQCRTHTLKPENDTEME